MTQFNPNDFLGAPPAAPTYTAPNPQQAYAPPPQQHTQPPVQQYVPPQGYTQAPEAPQYGPPQAPYQQPPTHGGGYTPNYGSGPREPAHAFAYLNKAKNGGRQYYQIVFTKEGLTFMQQNAPGTYTLSFSPNREKEAIAAQTGNGYDKSSARPCNFRVKKPRVY